ncbi:MAG: UDP-N-acetylmuramate--L-alanine ligase [Desulfohalobiaceae bacterium]|nr:UDP-N-acetylmuramate--L-alanine ligase [Desulfohalobiaceae bacterium]
MKTKLREIHMVGIGGSGMSGIAEVLINLGYKVSGSDVADNDTVRRLRGLGARIETGHKAENIGDAEVLVKSTAIGGDNPEVGAAREKGIPVIPRAEMLAELMRLKTGIAVAGTHGKTTATSLLAEVFKEAGMDPTVIIGGRLNAYGSHALMGEGEYLIAEADESDGSFLSLLPIMNVVTNVDLDHTDYYSDMAAVDEAFVQFMNQVPFYGLNVVCGDDTRLRKLLPRVKRPVLTYGLGQDNDLRADIHELGLASRFSVYWRGSPWADVVLSHPGRHNIQNALAAIAVAMQSDIPPEAVVRGLENFGGVGRRMEKKGEREGVLLLDDYGHHPREIELTLRTIKEVYGDRRLIVVFQPHRFTRTRDLFAGFCRAFTLADLLFLTEIYPASEDPIPGVSGVSLAQGIRQMSGQEVMFCEDFSSCLRELQDISAPGDVVLTLGAGDISRLGTMFLHASPQ